MVLYELVLFIHLKHVCHAYIKFWLTNVVLHTIYNFLAEMRVAFDMSCIVPVEALLVIDPVSIPEDNTNCISYGQDSWDC